MRDAVRIVIGSSEISSFLSYEIDSDVLVPADAFTCRVGRIDSGIKAGDRFYLYVNGSIEMNGVVDRVRCSYGRGSQEMAIEGRDLMGILVDSSVEEWKTIKKMKLKELAGRLLKNVPYIDASRVVYGNEKSDAGASRPKKTRKESLQGIFDDTSTNVCQYEPGVSVFEALSDYAQRHGLLMWVEPDGTLVFGELKGPGDPPEYSFCCRKTGAERPRNNIISSTLTDDISKRHSRITTVAQVQGNDSFGVGGHTITKSAEDGAFPFYKPLVLQSRCTTEKAAAYQVQLEVKKREAEGWRVEMEAAGHSQDGKNYRANTVCYIRDEVLGLDGDYLVLARKFTMDRQSGPRTRLTIGKLMEGYTVQ